MARIKVAHCVESISSGGVERRRLVLAQMLDRNRYDQIIICTAADAILSAQFDQAYCRVYAVGKFRMPFDARRIVEATSILRDFKPHIVHGAVFEGNSLAVAAGKLAMAPIIIGEETSDPKNRSFRGDLLLRTMMSFMDRMVAVSPEVVKYLERIKAPKHKIKLINNGVVEVPSAACNKIHDIRHRIGASESSFVIGCVGRVHDDHKRFSDLIRAVPRIRSNGCDARLLIVGDGPDVLALGELACSLKVSEYVKFVGFQAQTRPYFDAMDVFAHVAAREAFGLVLVEAMFASKAVVATRVGGMRGIIQNGITGLFVEPRRPDEIAAAVLELWRDPVRRASMGAAGLARARANYSAERYVSDVDALYQELMAERGVRP